MMLLLVLYITYHVANLRLTICKGTITLLPCKVTINEMSFFDPYC